MSSNKVMEGQRAPTRWGMTMKIKGRISILKDKIVEESIYKKIVKYR